LDLKLVEEWRRVLGLLPVPLFPQDGGKRFVLLNGTRGNFCLDLDAAPSAEARGIAWSSNVGHYISVTDRHVEVKRWDRPVELLERYDTQKVADQLTVFYHHLENDSPPSTLSAITHGVRVFRSLRTALGPGTAGPDALKAFLYLLACTRQRVSRESLLGAEWGLDATAADVARSISPRDWGFLTEDLSGRPSDGLTLDIDLLLRHAAGVLFQETHYEALLSGQLSLQLADPPPARITKETRAQGLHFTPPSLARTLVEESLAALGPRPESIRIFDPACGSGEFLREGFRQLRLEGYTGEILLTGWDISEGACAMARFALTVETRRDLRVRVEIRRCDSLADDPWLAAVDLVLSNPPFVAWDDLDANVRERVRSSLGHLYEGKPDLSSAFIKKAADCIGSRGVLASIVPTSLFGGHANKLLREALLERFSIDLTARLGSHLLFPDALVDAGLLVASRRQKSQPSDAPLAFWADYRSSSTAAGLRELRKRRLYERRTDPILGDGFSIYVRANVGRLGTDWTPRPYRAWALLERLSMYPKVASVFDVLQGARTGHNRSLLLTEDQFHQLPPGERQYFRPAVMNESIDSGRLIAVPYVFFPYDPALESEESLRRRVPHYYKRFLLPNREALQSRNGIQPERWWVLSRHREWQVEASAKLVSTYFGDPGSFAYDPDGKYVVVQGFAWRPRIHSLRRNIALAYLALLNSQLFFILVSGRSDHVGGGQWNLSKKYVETLPLPDLAGKLVAGDVIEDLARIGALIQSRGLNSLTEAQQQGLEEAVRAAYGLTADEA
jgi:adenine-specific DNA-methyltransferase